MRKKKNKVLTYPGIDHRTDAEESRPVRGEASLSAFLQQFILKGQLARNGSRCRCGRLDIESSHRPNSCLLRNEHRLRNQIRNSRRRKLHKETI
jgi:hypothetical protein